MARPPSAREAVLDAFERILIDDGERAATLEATAREAGVSKGGLLYHFGTKEALVDGLVARLDALVDDDVAAIADAPEGAIAHYLRSSVATGSPLDRVIVATARLAQGGHPTAQAALRTVRLRWLATLDPHVTDPTLALAISLIGDGLYFNSALGGEADDSIGRDEVDAIVALVERLATTR
ncbi:TetR/AcrR family transcriptional regulator [Agromyces mangrovi Wang et al. 2018]|uniref:TetR/AcrR family transcriptional regulator n=1 Tax=Agromyces mangrovi TaxID=1858653 RepID=UPI0025737F28|nr:TetR/AcrR family transcriptional regulator [Agromyces mangrovi]